MEQLIIIEKGLDGTYDARMEENKNLKIWFYGQGNTVQEAIDDLYEAYKEAKEICEKEGDILPDMNFKYKYDVASFLNYYSNKLTLAGLENITGINQGQLSHYVTGRKKPRPATVEKIERSLHSFAKEMEDLNFVC
jgi:predicted RNase H-like HicB family nuclease